MSTDRNLLFGILALQMDFISRDTLIEAMNAWVLDKTIFQIELVDLDGDTTIAPQQTPPQPRTPQPSA